MDTDATLAAGPPAGAGVAAAPQPAAARRSPSARLRGPVPPVRSVPTTFSTAGLPSSRRIELWEQYNARALMPLSCRPLLGDALEATERHVRTRRLRMAHITAAPHIAERAAREIERQPIDSVLLTVVLGGETHVYHRDGVITLRPGQAMVSDADFPSLRVYAHGHDHLFLAVPKAVYRDLVLPVTPAPYEVFELASGAGRSGPGSALAKLISAAVRGETADADALERQVLSLLRGMVTGRTVDEPGSPIAAAEVYIRQHLADPGLSAARVASALGVSERQVSRIFSPYGGVARWITDQRLDVALRLLTKPGQRSVAQVAQECGFGSQAYFARVFKRRFGASPRDVLQDKQAGTAHAVA